MVGPFMTETGVADLTADRPRIEVDGPGLGLELDREALAALRTEKTVIDGD
jgi:L-alanine-DL-glutamate epimerase-like enolase superfamily enzyme